LVRFRYAQDVGREELVAAHLRYYDDEEHMHAASVQRALGAEEAECTPPLLLVQPGEDANVPRRMTLDLVRAYQDAGGALHYFFYPGLPHAFAYQASPETTRLAERVRAFLD
jgi:dipeptidyl aminopeptidase/acylaminoacyl peptidase